MPWKPEGDYQRALAEGDLQGIVSTFEPDGYARKPSGGAYVPSTAAPRVYRSYTRTCSLTVAASGWSITPSPTTACGAPSSTTLFAGETDLPQAGVAIYERGSSGLLAAARIYDDGEPPAVSDTSAG